MGDNSVNEKTKTGGMIEARVLLPWPEGRGPLVGQPARCRVAGQARGHYAFG